MEQAVRELSCANCDAPIKPIAGETVVTCEYCGRSHTFVAPPPSTKKHVHKAGDSVAVLWGGQWWKATVSEVIGTDRWRVHYDGWSASYDEVVGQDRIRNMGAVTAKVTSKSSAIFILLGLLVLGVLFAVGGILFSSSGKSGATGSAQPTGTPVSAQTQLPPNTKVEIFSQGSWWRGHVINPLSDGTVQVTYDDYGNQWDEAVDRSRLRLLGNSSPTTTLPASKSPVGNAPLAAGQRLEIYWNNGWYPGSVVSINANGQVTVNYDGYDATQNETVDRSRLRFP